MIKLNEIKIGSNRNFGIVFCIVFLLVAFYPLMNGENIRFWSLIISLFFLILGLMNSFILTPLNKLWFKFGILLGKIISPLVMGVIFFFVVTLIAVLLRIFKKDVLFLKFDNSKTYWIKKSEPKSKFKNQF